MSFNVAFRVDATSLIGTGHFMRCLTLADALRQRGARIRFVSRGLPDYLYEMLSARDIGLAPLNHAFTKDAPNDLAHSYWLGASQERDASESTEILADLKWDWLIVDHYALDSRWESAMRRVAKKILVIDDLADRQHDCDVLLDQNYYQDMPTRYEGKVPKLCRMLLGPRYALLREEFRELHAQLKPRTGSVKRILLFFGGVDAGNHTGLAINALAGLHLKEVEVDVVIGAQHPNGADIKQACETQGYACHVQTSHMAELMAAADFAIGAGGCATWERCCLGLPTLCIGTASNQHKQIADAAEVGLLYALTGEDNLVDKIMRHAQCLMENPPLRRLTSKTAMDIVDGLGVIRVCKVIGMGDIEFKTATQADCKLLFEWRNHPKIRSASRNSGIIDWDSHCAWLSSVLAEEKKVLLIGHIGKTPVGVVRFDQHQECAEVSIYIIPDTGMNGQGRNVLLSAERWLAANRPDMTRIRAEVLGANIASHELFRGSGYHVETIHYLKKIEG